MFQIGRLFTDGLLIQTYELPDLKCYRCPFVTGLKSPPCAMLHQVLEHDPEKWTPLFRKDLAPAKITERQSIQSEAIAL
jgi:hypothetical protein